MMLMGAEGREIGELELCGIMLVNSTGYLSALPDSCFSLPARPHVEDTELCCGPAWSGGVHAERLPQGSAPQP